MDILRDKEGRSNIRLIILVFVVLSGIAAALLYFPPLPTRTAPTAPLKTSGDIKFMDSAGNPLSGAIELSGVDEKGNKISSGPPKPNVNLISWTNVPNAIISYDAFATKSLSINLRISGDSPKGRVVLENYGSALPASVNITAPGNLVKYVEVNSSGVSFADADISIKYTDTEVSGLDVNNLVIYRYDNDTQAWSELPTRIDAIDNILSTTLNSLSIFAVSTRIPQDIEVHDTKKMPVISDIKTYDEAKTLKREAKTSKLSSVDVPDKGELEVDALASKNVAVKLKVNVPSKGEIILDDFGKNNPVSVPLPGRAMKYVEIGASGISFSSADITIRYTDEELNGGNEYDLTIYHWNGASWDAMPTIVDTVNKTLSTTTTSFTTWGVATPYRYFLTCNVGTSLNSTTGGAYSTNFTCVATGDVPMMVGLLNATSAEAGVSSRLRIATAAIGQWDYARIINNTAFSTDVNITGLNGSISMYSATAGATVNGWYEIGYYNPNGTANNFVGLFNSTAATTTTATQTSFAISFNNKWGIIPAGNKSAVRVWMNATTSSRPGFWSYGTAANQDSSINVTIATPLGAGAATYNVSGYVTNKSSGLPLNGATVQTNTSLTTTTNVTGYYNFTGLSNGTYMVNASLTGYATNQTNVTISGANVANANISLSPIPTYLLSGYVTNASSGAAINGATVTTNTSQTTSTDGTGYYSFSLTNGTYLITASKAGYNDNSTTRTVNGAAVSGVNITLTPIPPSAGGKILVAANRFVILDDPNDAGAQVVTGSGFQIPTPNDWGSRSTVWAGIATTVNATAMYVDNNGFPVSGKVINFTIYWPNGTALTTVKDTTNSRGIANFSYNLDNKNFYGRWIVRADNGSTGANTSFIYNWWGCSWGTSGTCGSQHSSVTPPAGGSANSPYLSGRNYQTTITQHTSHGADWTNSDTNACTHCHQSFDNNTGDAYTARYDNHPADVHRNVTCDNANCHGTYTTHNTNQLIYSCYNSGCHGNASAWDRKDISNKSTLNSGTVSTAVSIYSYNNASTFNATFHNPNSTVPCIICHGPMHNITKPDETQRFIRNSNTEDSQCKACHTSYTEHNSSNTTSGGVNCTLCHSDDVHDIQVFAQNATYVDLNHDNPNPARGNCTNCHQNATFFAALEAQPKATKNYTGRDPPQIPVPLNHSTDPYAGALWNGSQSAYWDNTSQKSACYYCHGLSTLHSTSALGSISNVKGTNNLNQDLATSRWCANCHYKTAPDYGGNLFAQQPPEVLNASGLVPATSRDGTGFVNHSNYFSSGYNDSVCKNCHNNNLSASATSLNFSHNVAIGSGGAPNCIQCHNLVTGLSGGAPVGVNFTAVNLSVHYGINSQNATNWSYVPVIGACWACHDTDGNVSSGHPDKYKTPKICTDCHLANGTYYNQSVSWGLNVTVSEHYYSGDQIIAGNSSSNISSCINCHENVSEMIVYNNVTDNYGSFTGDGVGLNGGNNSFYHYGANRSDLRSWDSNRSEKCSYCHQNVSTNFSIAMSDPAYSKNVSNHSITYNSTNPNCLQCHNSGWIHNSTLTKPNLTLPNSTFCLSCHGDNGTGSTNYTGAVTGVKAKHNNSVNCTECHLNVSRDIHPVQYLQPSATYNTNNSIAVDCITCHQNTTVDSKLLLTPPKIPAQFTHSDDPINGTKWNATPGYWTPTNTLTACIYCHNDTRHNATALGRISLFDGSNIINSTISASTNWCASCHWQGYSSGTNNYNDTVNTFNFQAANLLVPPEITGNATYGANQSIAGYFNHISVNKDDATCKSCHGSLTSSTTMTGFMHNVAIGSGGGPDCISCHDYGKTGSGHRINNSAMNSSSAIHKNLNSNASNSSGVSAENKKCWGCHTSNGTQPTDMGDRYLNPYKCYDCHNGTSKPYANVSYALNVSEHFKGGVDIRAASTASDNSSSCTVCHNLTEMKVNYTEDDIYNSNYSLSSHYGRNRTLDPQVRQGAITNCSYCHQNISTVFTTAMIDPAYNSSILNHSLRYNSSNPPCVSSQCHNSGWLHNSTLTIPNLTLPNSTFCLNCHGMNSTTGLINFTGAITSIKQKHNNTINCTECHLSSSRDIHPMKYLQPSASYNTSNSTAVDCTNCHQNLTVYPNLSRTPPKIPNPMHHSDNASNGTLWNATGYWTNSTVTSCTYCHNDTKHNTTALGRPAYWKGNNVVNSSITSTSNWCAGCHYQGYSSGGKAYNDMTSTFTAANLSVPPEITNGTYAPYSFQRYYNHSLTNYTDAACKLCHGINLTSNDKITAFLHNITWGSCTDCHYSFAAMNTTTSPDRYVNSTMFNASPHGSVACSNCHTKGHKNIGARKACEDCHAVQQSPITDRDRHNITATPSTNVVTNVDCTSCHDSTLYNNATSNYGYNKSRDCDYCHTYPDKTR